MIQLKREMGQDA
jgi:hypothetical protein